MDTIGQHYIIDAFGCDKELLNSSEDIKKVMMSTLSKLQVNILLAYFHSFSPQGVTGIFALSTSHFSIHTWPEHGYAAFDLYTCSSEDATSVLKEILDEIGAKNVWIYKFTRGVKNPVMSKQQKFFNTMRSGNSWDNKVLNELKRRPQELIYEGKSPFQDIFLAEGRDLRLYLNNELQFSSLDEKEYHESLVLPAMELTNIKNRVLILGGGDGLALREVLKYKEVNYVDLVDIDPMVIELAKSEPTLIKQNSQSLHDKRTKIHIQDAKEFLKRNKSLYETIILDFPDPVDEELSSLYTKEIFFHASQFLSDDGVLVCQAGSPKDTRHVFWSIGKTLRAAGLYTIAYYTIVPSFGVWGFHLSAKKASILEKQITSISVPHDCLSENLEGMFHFPKSLQAPSKGLIINSFEKLQLHKLYQKEINKI